MSCSAPPLSPDACAPPGQDLKRPQETSDFCATGHLGQAVVGAPTLCSGQTWSGILEQRQQRSPPEEALPWLQAPHQVDLCPPAASVKTHEQEGVHTPTARRTAARSPLSPPLHLRLSLLRLSRLSRPEAPEPHVDTTSSTPAGRGGHAVDRLGSIQDIRLQMICDSISIVIIIITTTIIANNLQSDRVLRHNAQDAEASPRRQCPHAVNDPLSSTTWHGLMCSA